MSEFAQTVVCILLGFSIALNIILAMAVIATTRPKRTQAS